MLLTKEQKNDELVKSLLEGGFSEDVIAGWINSGAVTIEKSVPEGDDDEDIDDDDDKKPEGDEDDDDKDGDDDVEKSDDGEDGVKNDDDDKDGDDDEDTEKVEKSLISKIVKSISNDFASKMEVRNNDILKSLPNEIEKALEPVIDRIEKSLDAVRNAVSAFGNQVPSFKGADLSRAIIEKSIENGGGVKDNLGKTALSVSRDRIVVRELIQKSINEEKDENIRKSLIENSEAYILDPICGQVGEPVARYLFDNKNVRLVK